MSNSWLRFWFEIVMRTHAGEFKDWDREKLGAWIRHNLADMGCETVPMGSAWAVRVKKRPEPIDDTKERA